MSTVIVNSRGAEGPIPRAAEAAAISSSAAIAARRGPRRAINSEPGTAARPSSRTGSPDKAPIAFSLRARSRWISGKTGGTASIVRRRSAPASHNRARRPRTVPQPAAGDGAMSVLLLTGATTRPSVLRLHARKIGGVDVRPQQPREALIAGAVPLGDGGRARQIAAAIGNPRRIRIALQQQGRRGRAGGKDPADHGKARRKCDAKRSFHV